MSSDVEFGTRMPGAMCSQSWMQKFFLANMSGCNILNVDHIQDAIQVLEISADASASKVFQHNGAAVNMQSKLSCC